MRAAGAAGQHTLHSPHEQHGCSSRRAATAAEARHGAGPRLVLQPAFPLNPPPAPQHWAASNPMSYAHAGALGTSADDQAFITETIMQV